MKIDFHFKSVNATQVTLVITTSHTVRPMSTDKEEGMRFCNDAIIISTCEGISLVRDEAMCRPLTNNIGTSRIFAF